MGPPSPIPSPESKSPLSRVLVSRDRIAGRVEELAETLSRDYAGREVTILVVLTGALIFVSDLVRRLSVKLRVEPVSVLSYPGQAVRSQGPRFRLPLPNNLTGREVLIVDDIFDSGRTMELLHRAACEAGAARVRSCVLLRKARPDLPDRGDVDYAGFDIPDEFVVGYGLDFDGYHRNLPDIGVLADHARGLEAPNDE